MVVIGSMPGLSVRAVPACPGCFVGGGWCAGYMPRRREAGSPQVVHRTARVGLRVTRAQRRRLVALLVSAGDVWACVLELNAWRRARQDRPLVSYQGLCRELAASGRGTFGELDTAGARSVLRRYSDAWFAAAKSRRGGDERTRFPGGGGRWCRCAGTTAPSCSPAGCCGSRSPAAAPRWWCGWTGTCPNGHLGSRPPDPTGASSSLSRSRESAWQIHS